MLLIPTAKTNSRALPFISPKVWWLRSFIALWLTVVVSGCGEPETPSPAGSLARGDRFLEDGKPNEAISAYRVALHQDSLNPVALARLSRAYAAQGNRYLADMYIQRATNIPYERGLRELEAGNEAAAKLAFEETISLHPPHPLALNHLGEIHYRRGNQDSAVAYYETSARGFSRFPATFLRLGQLYMERNMPDHARNAFERTIELNINALDAYLGLGQLHLDQGDWQLAVERFDTALAIDPRSFAARAGRDEARSNL